MKNPLVKVEKLSKHFHFKDKVVKAVNNISFEIYEGETLGLVGESGCGKSTVAKTLLRLLEPTSGKIYYNSVDFTKTSKKALLGLRKEMQIIFQDSFASLNPRMTIEEIIEEPLLIHEKSLNVSQRHERVQSLLQAVGLHSHHGSFFPHELSGGQRQRVCIARALCLYPKFIVCDESIAALDVSIQAQMINLLKKLQKQFKLTYLFISHDLAMVKYLSDRVAVMYLGEIVELANSDKLYTYPEHPYTQMLLSAIPTLDIKTKKLFPYGAFGEVPSALSDRKGCSFCARCHKAMDICHKKSPSYKKISKQHHVSCFLSCGATPK